MTIEKGVDWGSAAPLAKSAPIVSSDRELAALFSVEGDTIVGPSTIGLTGGDLAHTVGARATADQLRMGERTTLPIDLGIVTIAGRRHVMAASLVIRRRMWAGRVQAAMNASFLGSWNVAPAGHPNDGRFDVIDATLGVADRLKARSRLELGAHVPHPAISIRRLKRSSFDVPARAEVWIDGCRVERATQVEVAVCPDATAIVI